MSMMIVKHDIKIILVDNESLVDVLFYDAFVWMNFPESQLRRVSTPLVSLFGNSVRLEGKIILLVIVRLSHD